MISDKGVYLLGPDGFILVFHLLVTVETSIIVVDFVIARVTNSKTIDLLFISTAFAGFYSPLIFADVLLHSVFLPYRIIVYNYSLCDYYMW